LFICLSSDGVDKATVMHFALPPQKGGAGPYHLYTSKHMSDEATITINGTHLGEEESAVMRVAVEAFTIVMAQGIEEKDRGVIGALTEPYVAALVAVQKLLDIRPSRRIQ
jgi:hypothetical protein